LSKIKHQKTLSVGFAQIAEHQCLYITVQKLKKQSEQEVKHEKEMP